MSELKPSSGYWTEIYMPGDRPSKAISPETAELNARLNASETLLCQRIGRPKVTALIRQFKAAATANPKLFKALYAKRDPYRWLAQHWAPRHERMQSYVKVLGGVLAQRSKH